MNRMSDLKAGRIFPWNIKKSLLLAKILNQCGKDMAQKYNLHHWDNSMVKSCVIVGLCFLKNHVYLVLEGKNPVATFQIKKRIGLCFLRNWQLIQKYPEEGMVLIVCDG